MTMPCITRPDFDRQDRGADRRLEAGLHDRHRYPQHAAGGAHLRHTAFMSISASLSSSMTPPRSSPIPSSSARRTTSPAGSARTARPRRPIVWTSRHEHIVRSFEQELQLLDKKIAQMGGLAERLLGQAFDALERRDPELAEAAVQATRRSTSSSGSCRSRPC